jgi:transposase
MLGHPRMMPTKPTILEVDLDKLEAILRRIEAQDLQAEDYATIRAVIESYAYLTNLLGDKNTTLQRLRKMLFGASTEKLAAVIGHGPESPPASPLADNGQPESPREAQPEGHAAAPAEQGPKAAGKGHGRNGADTYSGAEKIQVPHASLHAGDSCPKCQKGTIYGSRPGVLVRLVGQAPVGAKVYYLEKLRCHLCGEVFAAALPAGVGSEKCDATVGSMIALLKYGSGMPFHRAAGLQASLGIPLPASTQWDLVASQAERAAPAFGELVRQAAQGEVIYNDDTTARILELMGERARQAAQAEDVAGDRAEGPSPKESERSGLFTSGIVSTAEGRRIALFFSGRQHAGENLADVLAQRAAALSPPIQMCDALSRNLPGELRTILAHCLAHGRRQFVEVAERFPAECRHVLEALAVIYKNDALAREQNLPPEERLRFHQAHSGPTMEELHVWLAQQFEERRVEPNSALGKAIAYLLRHWEKLTLFLRQAGAPLDNNVCERALKKAILHRKNALFYKTCHGARVGDIFMSLIYTCELCGANPFDYLTALERHAEELSANPQNWMPWSYRQTLAGAAPPAATL